MKRNKIIKNIASLFFTAFCVLGTVFASAARDAIPAAWSESDRSRAAARLISWIHDREGGLEGALRCCMGRPHDMKSGFLGEFPQVPKRLTADEFAVGKLLYDIVRSDALPAQTETVPLKLSDGKTIRTLRVSCDFPWEFSDSLPKVREGAAHIFGAAAVYAFALGYPHLQEAILLTASKIDPSGGLGEVVVSHGISVMDTHAHPLYPVSHLIMQVRAARTYLDADLRFRRRAPTPFIFDARDGLHEIVPRPTVPAGFLLMGRKEVSENLDEVITRILNMTDRYLREGRRLSMGLPLGDVPEPYHESKDDGGEGADHDESSAPVSAAGVIVGYADSKEQDSSLRQRLIKKIDEER